MQFLPGAAESEYANEIYKHIYENWIYPYPVVDNIERRGPNAPPILPLPRKVLLFHIHNMYESCFIIVQL